MKPRTIDCEHGLHVIAAAVLVALGSSHAAAQQPGQQGADQPQTQQDVQIPSEQSAGGGELDQIAEEHDDLSSFVEAVKAAGMEGSLTEGTEYTVFAPTNDALEEMSGLSMEELMRPENREQLISLLRAHIVADDVDENMARTLQQAQTIDGGTIDFSTSGDEIRVGDASVVESGIQEGSLRVYAIDQVLEPTALARADSPASGSDSESESGSQLDTGSERDAGSELETELERESGSQLERDDPGGLENRPDVSEPGDLSIPRPGAPQVPEPGAERPGAQN